MLLATCRRRRRWAVSAPSGWASRSAPEGREGTVNGVPGAGQPWKIRLGFRGERRGLDGPGGLCCHDELPSHYGKA
jgi:hypothetical protein